MFKLILIYILASHVQYVLVAPTIDHNIINKLRQKHTVNVLIFMKDSTQSILNNLKLQTFPTREERLNSVSKALINFAASSQKNVTNLLEKEKSNKHFSYKVLWITNQLIINNADLDILKKLADLDDISKIEEEKFVQLENPIDLKVFDKLSEEDKDEVQWGVQQIQAPTLWKRGNRGQNIVIATIDSGARGTHEALRDNYAGNYGWFDPSGNTLEPNDHNGHGTHTIANIAGSMRNIGVAPGSKWAACRGCASSACSVADLLACSQWIICPTKADGSARNCAKAPHLVSNSWGGLRGDTWFQPAVEAWHAAQIIPIFSIGNSGPSCGTVVSPGDYENVIGVGSTTSDNEPSYFSSPGPTIIGSRIKPDIAAPGSDVFSAYHTSDSAYALMSGTSMACPHVAGVVALLLQENPNLTYKQVLTSLNGGGVPANSTGRHCAEIPEDIYPNHHVGSGRIDAVKTIATMESLFQN